MTTPTNPNDCDASPGFPPGPPEAHQQAPHEEPPFDLLALVATTRGIEVSGYSVVRTHMLAAGTGADALIQLITDEQDTVFWFRNQPAALDPTGTVFASDTAGVLRELVFTVSRPLEAQDVSEFLQRRACVAAAIAAAPAAQGGRA